LTAPGADRDIFVVNDEIGLTRQSNPKEQIALDRGAAPLETKCAHRRKEDCLESAHHNSLPRFQRKVLEKKRVHEAEPCLEPSSHVEQTKSGKSTGGSMWSRNHL
jgi:hypothetical protein